MQNIEVEASVAAQINGNKRAEHKGRHGLDSLGFCTAQAHQRCLRPLNSAVLIRYPEESSTKPALLSSPVALRALDHWPAWAVRSKTPAVEHPNASRAKCMRAIAEEVHANGGITWASKESHHQVASGAWLGVQAMYGTGWKPRLSTLGDVIPSMDA